MAITQSVEQLPHDMSNVCLGKHNQPTLEQTHEIVVHVLKAKVKSSFVALEIVNILLIGYNLGQVDNIFVIQLTKNFDFSHLSSIKTND